MDPEKKKQRLVHILFTLSLVLKAIDGFIEFAGGLVFVFLKNADIIDLISKFLHYNLFKISNEKILDWVTYLSREFTTSIHIFISVILICSGFTKLVLALTLLMRKLFAFPFTLIFLCLLLIYQIVQTFYTPSLILYAFNIIDFIVILVIWREYIHLKKVNGFR